MGAEVAVVVVKEVMRGFRVWKDDGRAEEERCGGHVFFFDLLKKK